jgi:hypothetical protein
VPALQECLEKIIQTWGGSDAFASDFYNTFQRAPAGSSQRARMMETMMGLMQRNGDLLASDDDLSELSEHELQSLLRENFDIGKISHAPVSDA